MTKKMTPSQILAALSSLPLDEQLAVHKAHVGILNKLMTVQKAVKATEFAPGQVVKFTKSGRGRDAGVHYIKITGYNRAGTCVVGLECDAKGNVGPTQIKWTVDSTVCTVV